MKKIDELKEIFIKQKTLTSKEVSDLGYARIYLSMLENQGIIFKVGRGVYSIDQSNTMNPLYEFQKNNKKIIYSNFTALSLLNFYSYIPKKTQISVPQGYNASRYINHEVFYNNTKIYGLGVIEIIIDSNKIKVYDIERSICDIIKEEYRFDKREYNKLINYYFNKDDINYQKLLEYSKLLKVSNKVQQYLSLFKA